MDPFLNMTKQAGHSPELQRLRDLHAVFLDALDGKLIQAPLDLQEPGKRIMDCGTADGIWLLDLRDSLSTQHHYFGSDLVDELFPQQPNGITYFKQSFTEPFVDEYKNSFDLVHLRGSMAGAAPKQPIDVVRNLATVLKPGGWVQLQEFNSWNPPSNGPALTDFAKMTTEAWKGIGVGDFANSMKSMLEEAGLKNVQERRVICQIGKMAKPELAAKGVNGIYGPVAPIASVASTVPSSFTKEELQALPGRVKEELENEGGQAEIIIVWGQRA